MDLKPCPMCGSTETRIIANELRVRVQCVRCGAETCCATCRIDGTHLSQVEAKEEAIMRWEAWTRLVVESAASVEVERELRVDRVSRIVETAVEVHRDSERRRVETLALMEEVAAGIRAAHVEAHLLKEGQVTKLSIGGADGATLCWFESGRLMDAIGHELQPTFEAFAEYLQTPTIAQLLAENVRK